MTWIRQTLSDGDKPSLSRQLVVVCFIIIAILEVSGHKVSQMFIDAFQYVCTWAFGSGAVSKGKEIAKSVSTAIANSKKPASEADV